MSRVWTLRETRAATLALAAAAVGFCLGATGVAWASSLNQNLNSSEAVASARGAFGPIQSIVVAQAAPQITPPARAGRQTAPAKALSNVPQPSPIDTADTVNKLLAPRPSDPNVPLPRENLVQTQADEAPLTGPRLYGRDESANGIVGGIIGLRIPIPADSGASAASTRSSGQTTP